MRCNLENYFSHQVSKKRQFFPIVASEVIFPLLRDQSCIVYLFFFKQLLLTFDPIIVEKVSILLLDMMVVSSTRTHHVCIMMTFREE